jgi:hypothetical protein
MGSYGTSLEDFKAISLDAESAELVRTRNRQALSDHMTAAHKEGQAAKQS